MTTITHNNANNKSDSVTAIELSAMRQNLNILMSQVKTGRVDVKYFVKQMEKLDALFSRIEQENARAKQSRQFEALYNVSRTLGTSLDLQTVLDQVMDAVIHLTGAERGFLMLRDPDGALVIKAARNIEYQNLNEDDQRYSQSFAKKVLSEGKSLLTTNALEDNEYNVNMSVMQQGLRSVMAVPLLSKAQVIGVAYVDSRIETDLFDNNDLTAFETLAGQAAIAIENARLFQQTDEELERNVMQLRQLRWVDLQLNETLDAHKAMEITLSWTAKLANATRGHLGLAAILDGLVQYVTSSHHYGFDHQEAVIPPFLDVSYPRVREVIESGQLASYLENGQAILILPILREGKPFGVVVLCRDGETQFNDDEMDIAERVINRAAITIENARLYSKLQAADQAKSEFVGTVAHELKGPMNLILGYATMTQMIGEDHNHFVERENEFLQKIVDSVNRMVLLTNDLADVSRIESGKFRMEPEQVKADKVLQAVRDTVILEMQARNHTYIEDIDPNLPDLYVDPHRLLQVLVNFTSNAYKYTPNGGTITLKVYQDGRRVFFSVKDTGVGLTPDEVNKLGTKFWRSANQHTREQPGTGLGFSITRSLVELMGGQIEIKSTPKVGSTFTFSVPVWDEKTQA